MAATACMSASNYCHFPHFPPFSMLNFIFFSPIFLCWWQIFPFILCLSFLEKLFIFIDVERISKKRGKLSIKYREIKVLEIIFHKQLPNHLILWTELFIENLKEISCMWANKPCMLKSHAAQKRTKI